MGITSRHRRRPANPHRAADQARYPSRDSRAPLRHASGPAYWVDMGASAFPMHCHVLSGDRTGRRLARTYAGQVLGVSPDTVRRRPHADSSAGELKPTPPRRGMVDVQDDAQADLGARVAEPEIAKAELKAESAALWRELATGQNRRRFKQRRWDRRSSHT